MPPGRAVVTGAAGLIGFHLVRLLKSKGLWVRGVDLVSPEFAPSDADEFLHLDLRLWNDSLRATRDVDDVYALAADMGGMGFISAHHAQILRNNALIDIHTLEASRHNGVRRLLFTSSACVYPEHLQESADPTPLREEQAYPAAPQEAYGWEKLLGERLCMHYRDEYGLQTRVARLHNVFGPYGTWHGGREKAPAAICRKVAVARLTGSSTVEIWGDGEQTRSFCYVDDCVEGIHRLMLSDHPHPLNLGQDRPISVTGLLALVAGIAGVSVEPRHAPGPQGARGRNSDNSRLRSVLGWEPRISLEDGLRRTYGWIEGMVRLRLEAGVSARDLARGAHVPSPRALHVDLTRLPA